MSTPEERAEEARQDRRENSGCMGCVLGLAHDHDDPGPCPECAAGKHGNCDGTTWDADLEVDGPADCPCYVGDHQ